MWTSFRLILGFVASLVLTSCTSDNIKRNTYQSLQTMQQHECLKQPGNDCPEPESYNKYEKKREEEINK